MLEEGLGYRETCRRFEVNSRDQIKSWERIYLEEGAEGFRVERRGRGSTGRPKKLPKEVEEDLLAEVQRLRAENEYLKNLQLIFLCVEVAILCKTRSRDWLPVPSPLQKVNVFINRRSAQIAHPRQLAHIQLLLLVGGIMAKEHGGNIGCGCLRSANLGSFGSGICHS